MDSELNNKNNNQNNSMAITGMVLAIISIVLCWLPLVGFVLGIVGLILWIKGLNKSKELDGKGKGFGIAGISCGAVGLVLGIIYTVVWIFTAILMKQVFDVVGNEYNTYKKSPSYNYYYNSSYNYDGNTLLDDYKF